MTTTPLELVKQHLAIDHDADDALLAHYIAAAEWWVGKYTGAVFTGSPVEVQAVLLLTGHSYSIREASSFARPFSIPYGAEDLLSPLKRRVTGLTPINFDSAPGVEP